MQIQNFRRHIVRSLQRRSQLLVIGVLACCLSGCSLLFGSGPEAPTATPTIVPVPTFTATPAEAALPVAPPATDTPIPQPSPSVVETTVILTPTLALTPTATSTPVTQAQLTVTDLANIRSGPDTSFALLGSANAGQTFPVTGKNAAGDWWQICCIDQQAGWIFGALAQVQAADSVPIIDEPTQPTPAPVAQANEPATATPAPEIAAPEEPPPTEAPVVTVPQFGEGSAGNFDPNAQYQIVHFKVRGLEENNGGIRDSSSQHHIFLTVLDAAGNPADGVVIRNAVGEQQEYISGSKGPGQVEITMYYEPFKLYVAADPTGPVTSQVSNQMGLVFPHLPDLVGKLGDENYEYGACPTLEIRCEWPITAIHFSYEITFQKVR
jgi:uncharacterized protein YraI